MLFRAKNRGAALLRNAMGAHFEHVAVIIKSLDDTKRVYVLDSTSNLGVALHYWDSMRKCYGTFYDKIVYRKLSWNNTNDKLVKLEKFFNEAIGKKYSILKPSFIMQKSYIPKEGEFCDKGRTFFCSELAAKIFKVIGVIPSDPKSKPSASFWPSTFIGNKIKFIDDACLEPEMHIIKDENRVIVPADPK